MSNITNFSNSTTPESESEPLEASKVYLGLLSVTIVSLLSLGGAVIGPLLKKDRKNRWLHFFLSMAVSTLSSDAILHIIPQVMGAHSHGHGDGGHGHGHGHGHSHDHDHDHDHDEHDIMWHTITPERRILLRLSVLVLSIYTLYFVEFFMFYRKTHFHYCSSPTPRKSPSGAVPSHSTSSLSSISIDKDNNGEENNNGEETPGRRLAGHELVNLRENDEEEGAEMCGLKPRALIILFGDGLHNLVDGIAIGASFMSSLTLGFITTIAVVCHELPHEIGDLAVLIDSGLPMCRALVLNLLSALTAYIGFFIAIALGQNEAAEAILLAVTAGMFLYVAWVDMLAHLKHDSMMTDHWMITGLLQICGFLFGFLLIFTLGWFENIFGH